MKTRILPLLVLVGAIAALAGTVSYAVARATDDGSAYGMMGRSDYAMMGSAGRTTAWFLDGTGGAVPDITAARQRAQRFADRLDLKTAEVMQFSKQLLRATRRQRRASRRPRCSSTRRPAPSPSSTGRR